MLPVNNQAHGVRKKVVVVPDLLQDYIVLGDVVLVSLRLIKELMKKGA
ncbi:hypothetical protein Desgi_0045 [Desulfoscipio gibsoniae DSM 7213]|uniref:Uncharacterized protein n=1 Tax=Desulfoscipio gibsoniae DSM 7213 TaxID=767817 RepID=R4KJ53_9FIRM|nr:hypothetical protein Desgi_0045 [Desulfoscipio gibsoniae DSM 7213]